MNSRWIFLFFLFGYQYEVLKGELSAGSCSLIRTATSFATMVPELAQLVMRYYSLSATNHPRSKRFLFNDQTTRDGAGGLRGTVLDQMVANAFKDVNYTKVAFLLFHNNESLAKLRQNFNADVVVRAMMREIDYEQFGESLWYALESEFNLERFIHSMINITHIDIIYEEMVTNGTVPEWFVKSIHPDLNVRLVNRMLTSVKNFTNNAFIVMSNGEKFDSYLFKIVQEKLFKPFTVIIQRIKEEKPSTLDQLVEIILSNMNRMINEQLMTTTKAPTTKSSGKLSTSKPTTPTMEKINLSDDLKLLFYQYSVMIQSFGQTVRVALKTIEQLYCTSIWD